jgi:hypothetical protein
MSLTHFARLLYLAALHSNTFGRTLAWRNDLIASRTQVRRTLGQAGCTGAHWQLRHTG